MTSPIINLSALEPLYLPRFFQSAIANLEAGGYFSRESFIIRAILIPDKERHGKGEKEKRLNR